MTITESFQQAAIFSALLVLLVMGLGTSVSLLRMRRGIYMGDGGDKGLSRAIRAHGNSAEHVPFLIAPLIILGLLEAGATPIMALGATSLFARCLHAGGRLGSKRIFSMIGATITYFLEFGMSVWILWILSA